MSQQHYTAAGAYWPMAQNAYQTTSQQHQPYAGPPAMQQQQGGHPSSQAVGLMMPPTAQTQGQPVQLQMPVQPPGASQAQQPHQAQWQPAVGWQGHQTHGGHHALVEQLGNHGFDRLPWQERQALARLLLGI